MYCSSLPSFRGVFKLSPFHLLRIMFLEIVTAQIRTLSVKGFQGIEDTNSEIIYLGSNSVSLEVRELCL